MIRYSPRDVAISRAHPATFLRTSATIGWQALFVQELTLSRHIPSLSFPATEDELLIVQLSGRVEVQADQGDGRNDAVGQAGSIASVTANRPTVAQWATLGSDPVRAVHLYLPATIMAAAAEGFRPLGRASGTGTPLTIGWDDPVIHAVAGRLLASIDRGEPDVYAQSVAHYLAAHLQTAHRFPDVSPERHVAALTDARIARVIDRMHAEFRLPLSVEELAREACISPFHFSRVFKRATGRTPFELLTAIRMKRAAQMLREQDVPIKLIARECGYRDHAAFSAAFRRWSGQSPGGWRFGHR